MVDARYLLGGMTDREPGLGIDPVGVRELTLNGRKITQGSAASKRAIRCIKRKDGAPLLVRRRDAA